MEIETEVEEKITEVGNTTMYIVYYNLTSIAAQRKGISDPMEQINSDSKLSVWSPSVYYGEALDRGVLYRMIGGRLGLEYMADSNRPVGGLRDRASADGIHRWMNWMCFASRSRCLSVSFSFSSELEVERDILEGVGVETDIRRVLGGIVAGRAMSAPLTRGVPDLIEGVMDR